MNILDEIYSLAGDVWSKREWVCDFCGAVIPAHHKYYLVRKRPNFTATLKACEQCAHKRLMADFDKIRGRAKP